MVAHSDTVCEGFERKAVTPAASQRARIVVSNVAVMMMVGIWISGAPNIHGVRGQSKRMDVARARRRWMREQGLFDPARLVFIDET